MKIEIKNLDVESHNVKIVEMSKLWKCQNCGNVKIVEMSKLWNSN